MGGTLFKSSLWCRCSWWNIFGVPGELYDAQGLVSISIRKRQETILSYLQKNISTFITSLGMYLSRKKIIRFWNYRKTYMKHRPVHISKAQRGYVGVNFTFLVKAELCVELQLSICSHLTSCFELWKISIKWLYSRLPVTRTLYNSNLPLTRSNFHFFQNIFYIILPSITLTPHNSKFFLFPLKVQIIGSRL